MALWMQSSLARSRDLFKLKCVSLGLTTSASTTEKYTALCMAARIGDLETVRVLLRHDRIDVNLRNRWFEDINGSSNHRFLRLTSIRSWRSSTRTVSKSPIRAANGKDIIDPPLCRAVAHGHLVVVSLLVQQGARLHITVLMRP
jgi:ankyrin repeat protein